MESLTHLAHWWFYYLNLRFFCTHMVMTKCSSIDLAVTLMIAVRKIIRNCGLWQKMCNLRIYLFIFWGFSVKWMKSERKKCTGGCDTHAHAAMQLHQSGSVSRSIKTECMPDLVYCVGYFDFAPRNIATIFIDCHFYSVYSIHDCMHPLLLSLFWMWEMHDKHKKNRQVKHFSK